MCGAVFVLEDEEGPIPLAKEPSYPEDSSSAPDSDFIPDYASAAQSMADQGQIVAPPGSPAAIAATDLPGQTYTDAVEEPRSYASNVLWTFLFPASPGNLVKFGIVWAALTVLPLISCAFMGFIMMILVTAWYAAFRLTVISSAAAGDNELPDLNFTNDFFEDLIRPLFAWIGSWIVVFLPALAYLVIGVNRGWIAPLDWVEVAFGGIATLWDWFSAGNIVLAILVCLGVAAWPITVLCIALGGFSEVYRVDQILLTIVRTFPAYLLTLVLMALAMLILIGVDNLTTSKLGPAPGTGMGPTFGAVIGMSVVSTGVTLYLDIVLMRLIGLYYHHFKERFALSWG